MSGNEADAAEIERLEERRFAAMLAADTAALEELLHDELVYMHSTGGADSKRSYIDGVRDGIFAYKSVERDDQTIRMHRDIGLVFSHMVANVEIRGNLRRLDNRILAVWSRDGGTWRLLALQSGAIPPPAP